MYLDARLIARARGVRPDWHRACELVGGGLPGDALGGLHYRESEFARTLAGEAGGPFGFDPGYLNDAGEFVGEGTPDECLRAIRTATAAICATYGVEDNDVSIDFFTACLVAAHELKGKIRMTPDGLGKYLKDAMWGYNGRAAWHTPSGKSDREKAEPDFSSYVMNDPLNHRTLYLVPPGKTVSEDGPDGRPITITGPKYDSRPGCWIVYQELMQRERELS